MSAAAARAALVAMQKKKKKKEEMIKSLMAKSNLTKDNREYLYKALVSNNDTQFIANISRGKPVEARRAIAQSDFNNASADFLRPKHLSLRHYNYLCNRFDQEFSERDKWLNAYVCQPSDIFSLKPFAAKVDIAPSPQVDISGGEEMKEMNETESSLDSTTITSKEKESSYHTLNELILFNQIVRSNAWFNGVIVFSILAAGVLVGIQSYPSMTSSSLDVADIIVQLIFSFECVFKILAEGRYPIKYWIGSDWRWNNFDFWLVFLCWLPAGGNVAFLRLLRLMRLLKLVSKVKQLQVIVMGLVKGLSAVSYIILLMLLIFYLFAVMGVVCFRDNDPFHFGSLGVSMLTLFRAATLEDWADVMHINWFGCDSGYNGVLGVYETDSNMTSMEIKTKAGNFPGIICEHPVAQPLLSALFFISFVLVAAFVTMALFVGAVCGGMYEALDDFKEMEEDEKKRKEAEEAELEEKSIFGAEAFRKAFEAVDTDCSGLIDEDELLHAMRMLGVEASVEVVREIMDDVDIDKNGGLDFDEFVNVMTDGKGFGEHASPAKPKRLEKKGDMTDNPTDSPRRLIAAPKSKSMSQSFSQTVTNLVATPEENAQAHAMYLASHIRRAWKGETNRRFETNGSDHWWNRLYFSLAEIADNVVSDDWFNTVITCTILAAGVVVGIQIELDSSTPLLDALDALILTIFTLEVVLKIMSEGDEPWRYFDDNWNCFDFFIVFACFIFMLPFMPDVGSMLAMLRLLRLLRVLKLVKALPQLRIITIALISGFGSITFVTIMLFLLFYLFANIGIIFFGENDPMHFGNLQMALTSLFVIATLDDWTDIMYINMLGCDEYGYEFGSSELGFEERSKESILNCTKPTAFGWYASGIMVVFVVLGSFVMLNLFIGIVSTAMEQAKEDQVHETKVAERLELRTTQLKISAKEVRMYHKLFQDLNTKKDGKLDSNELKQLVKCLPVLHFATAILDETVGPSEEPDQKTPFKVMNRRDMDHFVQFIDPEYYGSIEFPEFLVLMDFMKKVDAMPSLLYKFRESFEEAINNDSDDEEDDAVSDNLNESVSESHTPVVVVRRRSSTASRRSSFVIDENAQAEINDLTAKNMILSKKLEAERKQNSLMAMDLEATKRTISMLQERLDATTTSKSSTPTASTPTLLSSFRKSLSGNGTGWGSGRFDSKTDVTVRDSRSEESMPEEQRGKFELESWPSEKEAGSEETDEVGSSNEVIDIEDDKGSVSAEETRTRS